MGESLIIPDDDSDLLGEWPEPQTDLPEIVSAATLAALLGIKANRLHALARDGVMPRESDKTFRLTDSVQAYVASLRDSATGRIGANGDLAEAKLAVAREQAAKLELQNQTARAELVALSDVRAEWSAFAVDLRARLLAIPARVASAVGLDRATAAKIDSEMRDALESLSDDR